MNFLASMIYQQLFDTLVYKADNVYNGSLPIPVRCLLDEFANTGQIPDFENVIATTRSRGISVDVILQNLTQISKKLYKDSWETIIGNCDSFLYLGGNEQSTHKYISTQLGKETIDVVTYNESRGLREVLLKTLKSREETYLIQMKCVRLKAENVFICYVAQSLFI